MAEIFSPISGLPAAATPLAGTEEAAVVQGGSTVRAAMPAKYPPISAVSIAAGAIDTPLDGSAYEMTLSAAVDSGWTAGIPAGGDATAAQYYATLRVKPPGAGGPFAISIPAGWNQVGGTDVISLSAGDPEFLVYLSSNGATDVDYTAVQAAA